VAELFGVALESRAAIAIKGASVDVCSAGELAVTRSVSFPANRIVLHGNAKTPAASTGTWCARTYQGGAVSSAIRTA
jgi:hypothetical protein